MKKRSETLHFLRLVLRSLVALILLLFFARLAFARIYRDHLALLGWALAARHGPSIAMSRDISLEDGTVKVRELPHYLCLYDPATHTTSTLIPQESPWASVPVFRSDRQALLHADEAGLWEIQLETGEAQLLIPAETKNYYGYGLQYVTGTEDISFHDYSDGVTTNRAPQLLYVFHRDTGKIEAVCYLPDGVSYTWLDDQRVVLTDGTGLAIYDRRTRRSTHWLTLDLTKKPGYCLAPNQAAFVLSDDGSRLAWVGTDGALYLLSLTPETVDDRGKIEVYPYKSNQLRLCFSPDGEALLYCVRYRKNTLFNPQYDVLYLWAEGHSYPLYEAYPNDMLWFDW